MQNGRHMVAPSAARLSIAAAPDRSPARDRPGRRSRIGEVSRARRRRTGTCLPSWRGPHRRGSSPHQCVERGAIVAIWRGLLRCWSSHGFSASCAGVDSSAKRGSGRRGVCVDACVRPRVNGAHDHAREHERRTQPCSGRRRRRRPASQVWIIRSGRASPCGSPPCWAAPSALAVAPTVAGEVPLVQARSVIVDGASARHPGPLRDCNGERLRPDAAVDDVRAGRMPGREGVCRRARC